MSPCEVCGPGYGAAFQFTSGRVKASPAFWRCVHWYTDPDDRLIAFMVVTRSDRLPLLAFGQIPLMIEHPRLLRLPS